MADTTQRSADDLDMAHLAAATRRLPRLVEEASCAVDAPNANGSTWREAVAEALRQLASAVSDDARLEEAPNGFLAASAAEAPRMIHAFSELRAEHDRMLAEIDGCLRDVLACGQLPDVDAIAAEVRAALVRVAHHLERANQLAYEIAGRDLGPAD